MDVYISKREVIELCDWYEHEFCESEDCIRLLADEIKELPTIEAQPIRQGKWIWDDEGYHCSECFFHAYGNILECLDGTFKFCPVCGAQMNEGADNG